MKVHLISANVAATPYPVYPIGISVLARVLRDAGHDVKQSDFFHLEKSLDSIDNTVRAYLPDLIGISLRNVDSVNMLSEQLYVEAVGQMIERIRKYTDVKIILGGSGFSMMPEAILKVTGADYGIVGEGEKAIVEFVNNASKGIYPGKGTIICPVQDLIGRQILAADYDQTILDFYLQKGHIAGIQSKRGCVHHCIYCSYPYLEGKTIRPRDPADVVEDMRNLHEKHGAKYMFFTDSVFNDDTGHYMDVVREMKRQKVHIPWTAFFKPEGLDDEKVALMKETGMRAAEIGADATTDTTLHKLGKPFKFKDILDTHDLLGRHGISTAYYYMFGCPGETRATVLEGIANLKSLKKSISFIFMGIRILPHTPLYKLAAREGFFKEGDDLLQPVYYIAPGLDQHWLYQTLHDAFKDVRHCVFPPDSMDSSLQLLHSLGFSGMLWDMAVPRGNEMERAIQHENV